LKNTILLLINIFFKKKFYGDFTFQTEENETRLFDVYPPSLQFVFTNSLKETIIHFISSFTMRKYF